MSDTEGDASANDPTGGSAATGRLKRRAITVVQWVVALGAFWWVARDVDWTATADQLAGVEPWILVAILGVTALEFGSRFSMWYVLLNGREPTPLGTTARIDLVIKFVNHVVPSKAAGHSVAPLVVRHYTETDWSEAVTVAALNTGLYASLYGWVALVGVGLFATRLPNGVLVVIALSTALYVAGGTVVMLAGRRLDLAGRLFGGLERVAGRVPRVGDRLAGLVGKAPSFTAESAAVFRDLSSRPSVVVPYALGWAGTLMVFPGLRVWLLLTGLGGEFSPAVALPLVLVMAYSVTILPLTPGGVGVAEASATLVFTSLGVAPEIAGAVVLVDRSFGVYLPALVGWVPMADIDLASLLASDTEG